MMSVARKVSSVTVADKRAIVLRTSSSSHWNGYLSDCGRGRTTSPAVELRSTHGTQLPTALLHYTATRVDLTASPVRALPARRSRATAVRIPSGGLLTSRGVQADRPPPPKAVLDVARDEIPALLDLADCWCARRTGTDKRRATTWSANSTTSATESPSPRSHDGSGEILLYRMEQMPTNGKYPDELRERAVRLCWMTATGTGRSGKRSVRSPRSSAPKAETLRLWVHQAERDTGSRPGATTERGALGQAWIPPTLRSATSRSLGMPGLRATREVRDDRAGVPLPASGLPGAREGRLRCRAASLRDCR